LNIVELVRILSIIVIVAVVLSMVPLVYISPAQGSGATCFVTLDVCHATAAGLQSNVDTPFVCECPSKPFFLMSSFLGETSGPLAGYPLIVLDREKPPEF
jgi:hypothetical protein